MNHNYIVNEGSIMELENFRNFLAIIEAEGFTEASSYVEVEQPALSRQLKAIENYLSKSQIYLRLRRFSKKGHRNFLEYENFKDKLYQRRNLLAHKTCFKRFSAALPSGRL